MKQLTLIMIVLLTMTGCIFTPPVNERVVLHQDIEVVETIDGASADPIVDLAQSYLGVRYRYGGMNPSGFDCSGFICYVYEQGVSKKLPRTARAQSTYGAMVDKEALIAGDLLFFDTSDRGVINHSGIYIGDGKFIHASSGKVYSVTISTLNSGFYKRAFRWAGRVSYQ